MKLFSCPRCSSTLHFENTACSCGTAVTLATGLGMFCDDGVPCVNRDTIGCNWVAEDIGLCRSCAMTTTVPDTNIGKNHALWQRSEQAKRRALYSLVSVGWFAVPEEPLPQFHLLSEETSRGRVRPVMGHKDGAITINIMEADPAEIVKRRESMNEPFRTLVGHFRHELAHFLFWVLSRDEAFIQAFRALFGDERSDYANALTRHYESGPRVDWPTHHISAYASAHPHEDWAESCAHAIHLIDLVESCQAVGWANPDFKSVNETVEIGMEQAVRLNHLNRGLGLDDPYPFVVSAVAMEKLQFAARTILRTQT